MKIRRVLINLQPLNNSIVTFQRSANFIRGPNGAGKTVVLEALALAGHTPILDWRQHVGDAQHKVAATFYLSDSDVAFLKRLFGDDFSSPPDAAVVKWAKDCLDQAAPACVQDGLPGKGSRFWEADSLKAVAAWLSQHAQAPTEAPILLWFAPSEAMTERPELKLSLTDDAIVAKDWVCLSQAYAEYLLSGLLMSWSRPERFEEKGAAGAPDGEARVWRTTPRARSRHADPAFPQPGVISYVNTDMYNFGIGLDLRESPKHIKESDMTRTMVDRLQLFDREDIPGVQNTCRVRGFTELKKSWQSVLPRPSQMLDTYEFRQTKFGPPAEGVCTVSLSPESPREFLSSGENQLLFVLSMVHALEPCGGVLMIDEPELHMAFEAQWKLIDTLRRLAQELDIQLLMATHIPFLFREFLTDVRDEGGAAFPALAADAGERVCQLIYLRPGSPAMLNAAALAELMPTFQQDQAALTTSMELAEEDVRIEPIVKETVQRLVLAALVSTLLLAGIGLATDGAGGDREYKEKAAPAVEVVH